MVVSPQRIWVPALGAIHTSTVPSNEMEIVLVRHGQPEWVRGGLNVVDPPLTALGHRQAERLADVLEGERFDEVLVSPLVRARQTAAPLLARLGREEVVAPWLEEIRDPGWAGTPVEKAEQAYAELRRRSPEDRWHGLNEGESVRSFVDRIHLGVELFLQERGVRRAEDELPTWEIDRPGRRILLVAHAGTNSVSIGHMLGLAPTPWEWDRFVLMHTSISRLESIKVGNVHSFSLMKLSDVEHLDADERTR
jgi:broad specificity phosphatase PhoE